MRQSGFTYIGILIAVAIISALATASLSVGVALQQREREAELLAIGREYRAALQSYADATPAGLPTNPESLEDLLKDPRYPSVRRHLRRIYLDPLTGDTGWGLVRGSDGRISGIHSRSTALTLRRTDFPPGLEAFEKAESYDEWVFIPSITAQVLR